jgi:hypothetical protein
MLLVSEGENRIAIVVLRDAPGGISAKIHELATVRASGEDYRPASPLTRQELKIRILKR